MMGKKNFWLGKKVLVTGGAGFIGSHVVEPLLKKGAKVRVADITKAKNAKNLKKVLKNLDYCQSDLRNFDSCLQVTKNQQLVINIVARVAGIHYNLNHHGTMFRDNSLLNLNMIEAARSNNIERFLVVSSACVYPRFSTIPTPEDEGFLGHPEETNFGYGWAKRVAELGAKTYAEEFGMKIGVVRPYNAYGPRDHFDPSISHVIPALIRRIFTGEDPLVVWGSGKQTRAFLYVEDLAQGLLLAIEKYPNPDPINLGTDEEISIKDLVLKILTIAGRKTKVVFDTTKPDGHPRRNSDNNKAKEILGFKPKVDLEEGLRRTIEWYKANVLGKRT